jgi:hypothetical protein
MINYKQSSVDMALRLNHFWHLQDLYLFIIFLAPISGFIFQNRMQDDQLKKQEESIAKQEAMRRSKKVQNECLFT